MGLRTHIRRVETRPGRLHGLQRLVNERPDLRDELVDLLADQNVSGAAIARAIREEGAAAADAEEIDPVYLVGKDLIRAYRRGERAELR